MLPGFLPGFPGFSARVFASFFAPTIPVPIPALTGYI
jgi:hypothetical protein